MKHFTDDLSAESENRYFTTSLPYIIAAVLLVILLLFSGSVWHINKLQRNTAMEQNTVKAAAAAVNPSEVTLAGPDMQADADKTKAQQAVITQYLELEGQIIKELADSLSKEDLKLDFDSGTGTMRFKEADFFDTQSVLIKRSGQAILQKFVPIFSSVVLNDKYKDYIDEITIVGHSSGEGGYFYNLVLSRKRADAVAAYITGAKFPDYAGKKEIDKYLSTAGRSYIEPVVINGIIDRQKSRRVEFRFRLKDDMLINNTLKDSKGAN